jgi:hypothetical protein
MVENLTEGQDDPADSVFVGALFGEEVILKGSRSAQMNVDVGDALGFR